MVTQNGLRVMVLKPFCRRSSLRFEAQRRAAILPKDGTTAFAYVNATFFLIRLSGGCDTNLHKFRPILCGLKTVTMSRYAFA